MSETLLSIPTLTTERFVLRAPVIGDFDVFAAFCASDAMKFIGGPIPPDRAFSFLSAIIGHWQLRGFGRWIVADKVSDEPLGLVGLIEMYGWPGPEIAWSVFGEGRGIAAEAARATMDYAYDVLGWAVITCMIHHDNARSIALAGRLGFVQTGTFQDPKDGELLTFHHQPAVRRMA